MRKRLYTPEEVENIVDNALSEQAEEFNQQKEKEYIWNAINDLKEKVDRLLKENSKVGF